jgi:ABC-type multidrug transport system permease subunit
MVSPAYWAMDALHKLRFFQGGFSDILPHLGILLALAVVLAVVAGRVFKIRD